MQGFLSRSAALVAAAGAAMALSACGASASRPDPTPVTAIVNEHKPAPPHLPAHHAASAVFVLDLTDHATVRPATLFPSADGTLEHMQWSNWGAAVTSGHGTAVLRICTPSCVKGYIVSYPVTVTLSHPSSCFGAHFYAASSLVAETKHGPWRLISYLRNPC
jgi:hypothetical protein